MQLKKINPLLQQALVENNLTEANEMQFETFSTIKSGVDAVIQSPKGFGKSTTIVLNVLQRLEKQVGESTRALVFVQDKEQVLEMVELFKKLGNYMDIRVIGAHDKGDIDYDKFINTIETPKARDIKSKFENIINSPTLSNKSNLKNSTINTDNLEPVFD